jgi:transcriptional regulatory protein LevR
MHAKIKSIQEDYHIIATTGIKDPKIESPFISMDLLFSSEGSQVLEKVIFDDFEEVTSELFLEKAQTLCYDYLKDSFTFINPDKLMHPLWDFVTKVCQLSQLPTNETFYINLCLHTAGAIERELRSDTLSTEITELQQMKTNPLYLSIEPAYELLKDTLQIEFSDSEKFFILKIVENELNK